MSSRARKLADMLNDDGSVDVNEGESATPGYTFRPDRAPSDDLVLAGLADGTFNWADYVSPTEDELITGSWIFNNSLEILGSPPNLIVGDGLDAEKSTIELRGDEWWKLSAEATGNFFVYAMGALGVNAETAPAFEIQRDLGIRIFNSMGIATGNIGFESNLSAIRMTTALVPNITTVFQLDAADILHLGSLDVIIAGIDIQLDPTGVDLRLTDGLFEVGNNAVPTNLSLGNETEISFRNDLNTDDIRAVRGNLDGSLTFGSLAVLTSHFTGAEVRIRAGSPQWFFNSDTSLVAPGIIELPNDIAYSALDLGGTRRKLAYISAGDNFIFGDSSLVGASVIFRSADVLVRFDDVDSWQVWDTEALPNPASALTSVLTSDIEMIEITNPTLADDVTLTIHSDVPLGIPKLTSFGTIRLDQLPASVLNFIGFWDPITDGSTPPSNLVSTLGDLYIFEEDGNMTLLEVDNQTPHTVAVVVSDEMVFDDGVNSGNVAGWFYLANNFPATLPASNVLYDNTFSDWTAITVQQLGDEISDRATLIDRAQTITENWRWEGIANTFAGPSSTLNTVLQLGQQAAAPNTPLVRLITDDSVNILRVQFTSTDGNLALYRADGTPFSRVVGTAATVSADTFIPDGIRVGHRILTAPTNISGQYWNVDKVINQSYFFFSNALSLVFGNTTEPVDLQGTSVDIVHGGFTSVFQTDSSFNPAAAILMNNATPIFWKDASQISRALLNFTATHEFELGNINLITVSRLKGTRLELLAATALWRFETTGVLNAAGTVHIPNATRFESQTVGGTPIDLAIIENDDIAYLASVAINTVVRANTLAEILVTGQSYTFSDGGVVNFGHTLNMANPLLDSIVQINLTNDTRQWRIYNDGGTGDAFFIRDSTTAQNRLRIAPFANPGELIIGDQTLQWSTGQVNGNAGIELISNSLSWFIQNAGDSSNNFRIFGTTTNFQIGHGISSVLTLNAQSLVWGIPSAGNNQIQVDNTQRSWGLVNRADISLFAITDLTAGLARLTIDYAGDVDIAQNLTVGGTFTVGALGVTTLTQDLTSVADINEIGASFGRSGGSSASIVERGIGIVFRDASNPTYVAGISGIRQNPAGNFNGELAFFTNTGGAPANAFADMIERMRIDTAGFVGIGTDNPQELLHLEADSARLAIADAGGIIGVEIGLLGGGAGFFQQFDAVGAVNTSIRSDNGASFINGLNAQPLALGTTSAAFSFGLSPGFEIQGTLPGIRWDNPGTATGVEVYLDTNLIFRFANASRHFVFAPSTNGRVGIAENGPTFVPQALLHVQGVVPTVLIEAPAVSQIARLTLRDFDNGDYSWQVGTGSLNGISLFDNTLGAHIIFVTSVGNVSIGGTTATSPGGFAKVLAVEGTTSASLDLVSTSPAASWSLGISTSDFSIVEGSLSRIIVEAGGDMVFFNSLGDQSLYFDRNKTTRIRRSSAAGAMVFNANNIDIMRVEDARIVTILLGAALYLENQVFLRGKTVAGAAQPLTYVDGFDQAIYGNSILPSVMLGTSINLTPNTTAQYNGVEIATVNDVGTLVTDFESAATTIAIAGSTAHGLGRVPDGFEVVLRCAVANNGWAVGDEIMFEALRMTNDSGKSGYANATVVGWSWGNATVSSFINRTGSTASFTNTQWRIVMRAWIYT